LNARPGRPVRRFEDLIPLLSKLANVCYTTHEAGKV
jgi:hypothetical protein